MSNLNAAIVEHFCRAQSEQENELVHSDGFKLLWSKAKFKPVGKVLFKSASSTANVSYHIPAAKSLEIEFATRAAVSSIIKVHTESFVLNFPITFPLCSSRLRPSLAPA
jgi:hypothetical protein